MNLISQYVPADGLKILIILALSLLIGIEREESKAGKPYAFGGVRTFPLIGLLGYSVSFLTGAQAMPVLIGLAVVGGFMLLSYQHKLRTPEPGGITTEVTGLITYVLGAMVQRGDFWIASTLVVLAVVLLELKTALETLSKRIGGDEILIFTQFLILTVVILPAVPDREFTPFQLNPYKTWLTVVAVSGVSYASYVLQKLLASKGGVLLAAVLGGAYSSTATTISLAKKAAGRDKPLLYSGGILIASAIMYLRLSALVALFNPGLAALLAPVFLSLFLIALSAGFWIAHSERDAAVETRAPSRNPLELGAAMVFAAVFLLLWTATQWVMGRFGERGVFAMAAIGGSMDVDPFILSMTHAGGHTTAETVAAAAIVIAASSNNLMKGCYAWFFARGRAGAYSLAGLAALSALGLTPLFWLLR